MFWVFYARKLTVRLDACSECTCYQEPLIQHFAVAAAGGFGSNSVTRLYSTPSVLLAAENQAVQRMSVAALVQVLTGRPGGLDRLALGDSSGTCLCTT